MVLRRPEFHRFRWSLLELGAHFRNVGFVFALIGYFCLLLASLCTDLLQQWSTREIDVGHRQRHERARCILGQPAIANLVETPQPLDHPEDMLDPRTDL